MAQFIISLAMVLFSFYASAQTYQDTTIYKVVEVMPEFPGGHGELSKYLTATPFPPAWPINFPGAIIYIGFIVEKNGSLSNIEVARSWGKEEIDAIAMNHIKDMPRWTPGYHKGLPVRVKIVVPLRIEVR